MKKFRPVLDENDKGLLTDAHCLYAGALGVEPIHLKKSAVLSKILSVYIRIHEVLEPEKVRELHN